VKKRTGRIIYAVPLRTGFVAPGQLPLGSGGPAPPYRAHLASLPCMLGTLPLICHASSCHVAHSHCASCPWLLNEGKGCSMSLLCPLVYMAPLSLSWSFNNRGEREITITQVPSIRSPGSVTLKGTLVVPANCKVRSGPGFGCLPACLLNQKHGQLAE